MNIPQLRFDGFNGEWNDISLGELGDFMKGMALSKADISEEGEPCILYGELYTKYGAVISHIYSKTNSNQNKKVFGTKNDVLIPSSGETTIDIACASALEVENILLGGDLNLFRPKEQVSGPFLSYQINGVRKYELSKLAQGASVVHLYSNSLKNFIVKLPTFKEQQKIASFLISLDKKIERQQEKIEKLEQFKKGMQQKIFSQELRFKDKDGGEFPEWEETFLGEIITTFSGGTPLSSNPRYYGGDIPFIRSGEIYGDATEIFITEEGLKNSSAKMIEVGDLLLALYGATSGEIAMSKMAGAINQAILCIRSNNSLSFIMHYWRYKKETILKMYLQGGQGNISAAIVKNIAISLPCEEEQKKIGIYFDSLEKKVEKEKEKLLVLEEQKKGFMQGVFV